MLTLYIISTAVCLLGFAVFAFSAYKSKDPPNIVELIVMAIISFIPIVNTAYAVIIPLVVSSLILG